MSVTTTVKRTPRAKPEVRTFDTQGEASAYVLALPKSADVVWEAEPPKTPRAMWTGVVQFGIVTFPAKLYAATEESGVSFKQTCPDHGCPIHYKRWCEDGEHEVPNPGKGISIGKTMVPMTENDMADLPGGQAKTVAIEDFVPAGTIPALARKAPYFLGPDKLGGRAYRILVEALRKTEMAAVARVTIRERESLASLELKGEHLVLWTLHWPTEIRSPERLNHLPTEPAPQGEVDMAAQLVHSMSRPGFEPWRYEDTYGAALRAKAEAKLPESPEVDLAEQHSALMDTLAASIEQAKAGKRGTKLEVVNG